MSTVLLPCPFCGGDSSWVLREERWHKTVKTAHFPRCFECGMNGNSSDSKCFAAESWNRRATGPPTPTGFALELMMTGGNHLANILIKNLGADFADRLPWMARENARKTLIGDDYDVWCCWSAIMRARDLIEAGTEKGIAL